MLNGSILSASSLVPGRLQKHVNNSRIDFDYNTKHVGATGAADVQPTRDKMFKTVLYV